MTVTPEVWRATGQKYVDLGYGYGFCDRCGGTCHEFDCSGLQCHISNETGLTSGLCTTSFVMARLCTDLGLEMGEAFATSEEGPEVWWAFKGADHGRVDDGSRPNGASGHVVTVVRVRNVDGSTDGYYTIEAMGRAYGCDNGAFWGRGWTGHYKIPGITYAPPPPKVEPQMSQQLNARLYNPQTKGWFEGYADGRVDHLNPNGAITHGGMVTDKDRRDFVGRTLATLETRWVVHGGVHTFAYTIRATSKETYIPENAPR